VQENKIKSARVTYAREMRKLVLLLSLFLSYSVALIEEILCIYLMCNIHNVDKFTMHFIWRFRWK